MGIRFFKVLINFIEKICEKMLSTNEESDVDCL